MVGDFCFELDEGQDWLVLAARVSPEPHTLAGDILVKIAVQADCGE
ncbi:hypothetical protein [Sinorhizobium meliloti]|nr:hypothetical protein [Sinorhizobium meliloti]